MAFFVRIKEGIMEELFGLGFTGCIGVYSEDGYDAEEPQVPKHLLFLPSLSPLSPEANCFFPLLGFL